MGGKAGQAKGKQAAPESKSIELYERLIATCRGAVRKGKANPYTSRNGHMTSYLAKDGSFHLRLPAGAREAFLSKYKTSLSVAYGTVMKEYVAVPAKLFGKTELLAPIFAVSWKYVGSLKPKPTTRR